MTPRRKRYPPAYRPGYSQGQTPPIGGKVCGYTMLGDIAVRSRPEMVDVLVSIAETNL